MGTRIQPLSPIPPALTALIQRELQTLKQFERQPNFLQSMERQVNAAADPMLQMVGLTSNGWTFEATDFARKTAAEAALQQLHRHIAATGNEGEVPASINPVTLDELGLQPRERENLLKNFAGGMLEGYRPVGQHDYLLRVRARDRKQTLYELTATGSKQVDE